MLSERGGVKKKKNASNSQYLNDRPTNTPDYYKGFPILHDNKENP